jgi:hypothetical protein
VLLRGGFRGCPQGRRACPPSRTGVSRTRVRKPAQTSRANGPCRLPSSAYRPRCRIPFTAPAGACSPVMRHGPCISSSVRLSRPDASGVVPGQLCSSGSWPTSNHGVGRPGVEPGTTDMACPRQRLPLRHSPGAPCAHGTGPTAGWLLTSEDVRFRAQEDRDSDPGHPVLETGALTAELPPSAPDGALIRHSRAPSGRSIMSAAALRWGFRGQATPSTATTHPSASINEPAQRTANPVVATCASFWLSLPGWPSPGPDRAPCTCGTARGGYGRCPAAPSAITQGLEPRPSYSSTHPAGVSRFGGLPQPRDLVPG